MGDQRIFPLLRTFAFCPSLLHHTYKRATQSTGRFSQDSGMNSISSRFVGIPCLKLLGYHLCSDVEVRHCFTEVSYFRYGYFLNIFFRKYTTTERVQRGSFVMICFGFLSIFIVARFTISVRLPISPCSPLIVSVRGLLFVVASGAVSRGLGCPLWSEQTLDISKGSPFNQEVLCNYE